MQLTDVVRIHSQYVTVPAGGHQVRGFVVNNKVLRWHKPGHQPTHGFVVVGFLKAYADQRKHEQHAIHLVEIFFALFGDLVVHVVTHTSGLRQNVRRFFAYDLSFYRPVGGAHFRNGASLKLQACFKQHGVVSATRTVKRLRHVFKTNA